MIVKDVDINENGEKNYVFGVDEQLGYLKQSIRNMANAIDNETPDLALWEIRRVVQAMEEWDVLDAPHG